MNKQLKKFKRGDIVLGKVIGIEPSKALIKIEDCEPVYIIKEVASTQEIKSIEEVLQLNRVYEFAIAIDYTARYYKTDEYYLSIVELEYLRRIKRLEQLAAEDVTIYSEVIQAYDYGVLIKVENRNFIVSNIYLKTKTSNQKLVGIKIPIKFVAVRKNNVYNEIFASHRWTLESTKNYSLGDIVIGKVIELKDSYALIDIGAEKLACIELRDVSVWAKSCKEVLHINLIREFLVSSIYHYPYSETLGLSIKELERQIGWERLQQVDQEKTIFYCQQAKRNTVNNGFLVNLEGVSAFLPDSHISCQLFKNNKFKTKIPFKIIRLYSRSRSVVISNRKALTYFRLKQIKVGDLITGKILAIKKYGLFIQTDNITVLLHISEVSQVSIGLEDLYNIFRVGDDIKALIIWMDIHKGRVSVSTKELEIDPGDMLKNPQLVYENAESMAIRYRELVLERLNKFE
ncbi:S1 RNA-binding domain-containing protein [Myxosarcina sp. GI1]|uniref:S1 RNA-binding domain-containing protein n=1 Tax=Myxosarcina sp. GI1 TaxID=1541065 RepID=UPI00069078E9|nr:S1 RNA-binding domain-containing protein [Myxosarcina sp. GI1]